MQIYPKISLFCFQTWNQKWNCDPRLPYILVQVCALFRSWFRVSVRDALIPVRPERLLHTLTVLDQVRTFLWEKKKINVVELFNFKFVISFFTAGGMLNKVSKCKNSNNRSGSRILHRIGDANPRGKGGGLIYDFTTFSKKYHMKSHQILVHSGTGWRGTNWGSRSATE